MFQELPSLASLAAPHSGNTWLDQVLERLQSRHCICMEGKHPHEARVLALSPGCGVASRASSIPLISSHRVTLSAHQDHQTTPWGLQGHSTVNPLLETGKLTL